MKIELKAWSLKLDEMMKQINNLPYKSLPTRVTLNHIIFGQKRKAENQDLPNIRDIIITISEDTINYIYATRNPNINESNVDAFELALETNI